MLFGTMIDLGTAAGSAARDAQRERDGAPAKTSITTRLVLGCVCCAILVVAALLV